MTLWRNIKMKKLFCHIPTETHRRSKIKASEMSITLQEFVNQSMIAYCDLIDRLHDEKSELIEED